MSFPLVQDSDEFAEQFDETFVCIKQAKADLTELSVSRSVSLPPCVIKMN